MPQRHKAPNVGVEHGAWGEDVAVEYLRIHGYEIVDRNVHPCRRDQRLEIDVIAYDRMFDVMAFVEVKAPGKEPRPLQKKRHTQLRVLGFAVFVLDDPDEIPGIIREVTG